MVDNVNAEIIAGFIVLGLTWAFLPIYVLLKPKAVDKLCRFVPGQTPDDFFFYWNHWAIRLALALIPVGIVKIVWEGVTGGPVSPVVDVAIGAVMFVLLVYFCVEKWQQWREKKAPPVSLRS